VIQAQDWVWILGRESREVLNFLLGLLALGRVLGGAEAAQQLAVVVELQLRPLAHPLHRVADDDAVLNVVRRAA